MARADWIDKQWLAWLRETVGKCEHCGMSDYGCRGDDCPTGECHSSDECDYRLDTETEEE